VVAAALAASVIVPAIPILVGALAIVAAGVHAWSADLRPFVQLLLRVPVTSPQRRHARLALVAGAGVLLIAVGAVGATVRGQVRSRWEQREGLRASAEESVADRLERVRVHLASGDVESAELVLLDADTIAGLDAERREEVAALLERVQRSGDAAAILDVLTNLTQREFDAFERGGPVPTALEFPERALTAQAVHLALDQIDEAQRVRALR
jgi:hypothetical protein